MWPPMRRAPARLRAGRPARVELAARWPAKSPMTAYERVDLVLACAKSLYISGQATEQMEMRPSAWAARWDCAPRSYRAGANWKLWPTAKMARSRSEQWPLLRA
jgi:hypothetical protein